MPATRGSDLNQVVSQHDTLLDLLRHLDAEPGVEVEAKLIVELDEMLAKHFELEEAPGGFFARTLEDAPLAGAAVDRLVREHRQIRRDAADVAAQLQACVDGPVAHARRSVRRLTASLRQHEADESDLLADALNQDIGGGS